jgi:hypothetical protein
MIGLQLGARASQSACFRNLGLTPIIAHVETALMELGLRSDFAFGRFRRFYPLGRCPLPQVQWFGEASR